MAGQATVSLSSNIRTWQILRMSIAFLLMAQLTGQAPADRFDPNERIEQAIQVIRPVAYRSKQIDWPALNQKLRRLAVDAKDDVDMLPVWATLAQGLGDRHSFIQPTATTLASWRKRYGDKSFVSDALQTRRLSSIFTKRTGAPYSKVAINNSHDGIIVVVAPVSGFGAEAGAYATKMFEAIADAGPRTCGYIVDLRGNTGGNVWPMLLGLSALLGDGPQGLSQNASGKVEAYATLSKGSAVVLAKEGRGATMMSIAAWRALPRLTRAPVALLIDDATASSGEGVAVAFAGRPSTRTFGSRSYGVASSNEGFALPDGTNMVVTTGMMVDRRHRTYPNGIAPDQAAIATPDTAVVEARRWLSTQSTCRSKAVDRKL